MEMLDLQLVAILTVSVIGERELSRWGVAIKWASTLALYSLVRVTRPAAPGYGEASRHCLH